MSCVSTIVHYLLEDIANISRSPGRNQGQTRVRRKGFGEILLGKETIPKDNENFDLSKLDEKAKSEIRKKNELTFKELVLLIDTSRGDGHVAFQLVCCCKNDDYKNGNAADAWA